MTVKHTNPPNHAFAGVELKVGAEWTNEKNQKFQIKAIEGEIGRAHV